MSTFKIGKKGDRLALPPMLCLYNVYRTEPVTSLYSSSSHSRGTPLICKIKNRARALKCTNTVDTRTPHAEVNTCNTLIAVGIKELELENFGGSVGSLTRKLGNLEGKGLGKEDKFSL